MMYGIFIHKYSCKLDSCTLTKHTLTLALLRSSKTLIQGSSDQLHKIREKEFLNIYIDMPQFS